MKSLAQVLGLLVLGLVFIVLAGAFAKLYTLLVSEPPPPPQTRFVNVSGPDFTRTEVIRDTTTNQCYAVVAGMYGLDTIGPLPCE